MIESASNGPTDINQFSAHRQNSGSLVLIRKWETETDDFEKLELPKPLGGKISFFQMLAILQSLPLQQLMQS